MIKIIDAQSKIKKAIWKKMSARIGLILLGAF